MAQENRISQTNPETGASSVRQSAENFNKNGESQSFAMTDNDKLIYQLVQNNVQYAGEQFSENLSFNSIVLTDVLYANIYNLLGHKLNEDDFVTWVADQLIEQGCVIMDSSQSNESSLKYSSDKGTNEQESSNGVEPQNNKQDAIVVTELDQSAYDELVQKIYATISLIKASRLTIFKLLSDIDGKISKENEKESNSEDISISDEKINELVSKIRENDEKAQEFSNSQEQVRKKISLGIGNILKISTKPIVPIVRKKSFSKNAKKDDSTKLSATRIQKLVKNNKSFNGNNVKRGTKIVNIGKKSFIGRLKRKISISIKKTKRSISRSIQNKFMNVKRRISNSIVGKTFRGIKKIGKVMSGVAIGTVRGVAKLAKMSYNTAKIVGKGFVKASNAIGKGVFKVGSSIGKFVSNAVKTKGKNIINASGATFVTKLGIKALKFVGKKLWKGIKKVGVSLGSLLGRMFQVGVGFANKIGTYASRIGRGIKDKTYKFLIKPLSQIMVSTMGFAIAMIKNPIEFMKQTLVNILNRVSDMIDSIKQVTKKVLGKTIGIFKKILFNPITMLLIVGGIFYLFRKPILKFLNYALTHFKEVWSYIVGFAQSALSFLKGTWDVLTKVGGFLIGIIDKITHPDGIIAKTIMFVAKTIFTVKSFIKKMLVASGRDSVDLLCMWLSGDFIGIAFRLALSAITKIWSWLKRVKLMKIMLNFAKSVVAFYDMMLTWPYKIMKGIASMAWAILKGNAGDALKKLFQPFTDWWDNISGIWRDGDVYRDVVLTDQIEENGKVNTNVDNSFRSLKMVGTNSDKVLQKMDEIAKIKGVQGNKSTLQRLQSIKDLYDMNSSQVKNYHDFISQLWESGKVSDDVAERSIKVLLESPSLSQKLLSAFFYYNPQTGKLMTTRPQSFIEQFLNNIRDMVSKDGMSGLDKFQELIMSFEQLNQERAVIVNRQGEILDNYCKEIAKFDLNDDLAMGKLSIFMRSLNKNTMFDSINNVKLFKQMKEGEASTQALKSVTGKTFGTSSLLKIKEEPSSSGNSQASNQPQITSSDFEVVKKPEHDKNKVEPVANVFMSKQSFPEPKIGNIETNQTSLVDEWHKHQQTRAELFNRGISEKEIDAQGYRGYSYDEFVKMMTMKKAKTLPHAEDLDIKQNKEQRLRGLRIAKDIQAFNSQGKVANINGFDMTKQPSILSIETDGLNQVMYLYSPEWIRTKGASLESDDELLLQLDSQDQAVVQRVRKAQEEKKKQQEAEEKERKRQQEILDYSAKVTGGEIEVKIGEDVTAMHDAWILHQQKRAELFNKGVPEKQIIEMGFIGYSWEEWKKYYRKMHGLPEDGIKRIKFEGERKKRKIDWNPRKALSMDELGKYGIQMSEDGPVMIPLDAAMKAAKDLFNGAKTIHSIRDGLEVMRQGLENETNKLKQRREEGIPIAMVQNDNQDSSNETQVISSYN